ncbi:hypothetical protein ACFWA4_39900 [Streptomyces sp. NPDC060011]|uniref:hypothetical protein n=1 Tax=Streptomyces sp. NPDC060011 TaxID=3347037 RepID=UPI0036C3701F
MDNDGLTVRNTLKAPLLVVEMAEMAGEFHEARLRANRHEFGEESLADGLARAAGFAMFAGGAGATALGHPGGAGVAVAGFKIALGDKPAQKLKSHITGAGASAATGEVGKRIAKADPFDLSN